MFFAMLAASMDIDPATNPQLSSISVVSTSSGACAGNVASPAAAIGVAWTATNFDPDVHRYKLYENDVLKVSTITPAWAKTITGSVEDGPYQRWTSDWTYRVDVVNAGNGVVLASLEATPWETTYGSCRDLGEPT